MNGFTPKWLRAVPVLGISLLAVACVMGNSAPAQAADICASPGSAQDAELRVGMVNRSYRYFVPATASEQALPLVVALHGGWGTGKALADQSGLDAAAERHGFAVVYPNGIWRSWNAGNCCGKAGTDNIDDVGFIRALVKELRGASCIDEKAVFATGFSNGAMMTHRLACEAPELFNAIAPVSGGPMIERCASDRPMPALLLIGRKDERIPWDGGTYDDTYRPSIAEQVQVLAKRNRCDETTDDAVAGGGDSCTRRASCGGGATVWCVIDGVGHQWPGGKTLLPRLLGPNRDVVDASDLILRFFKSQR